MLQAPLFEDKREVGARGGWFDVAFEQDERDEVADQGRHDRPAFTDAEAVLAVRPRGRVTRILRRQVSMLDLLQHSSTSCSMVYV